MQTSGEHSQRRGKEKAHRNLTKVFLNNVPHKDPPPIPLTAAEVTEDLLKSRSASLNFRFLRSFLLLEFLQHTQEFIISTKLHLWLKLRMCPGKCKELFLFFIAPTPLSVAKTTFMLNAYADSSIFQCMECAPLWYMRLL